MHYYQFNIGDYRRDTHHLSMMEHGAYRQLLDWIYLEESPIPRETEVVFRRLCARTKEEQNAVEIVLKEMFDLTEEGYIQGKCMSVIAEYHSKADRARNNGKLGGRPKKTKVVISGNPEETQTKANSLTQELKNSLTQELKTGNSKTITPASRAHVIFPNEISEQLQKDFTALRKAKKSPVTQTAIDGINREAEKAGFTLQAALEMCCQRGWVGFKAEWIADKPATGGGGFKTTGQRRSENNRSAAEEWLANSEKVVNP